MGDDTDDLARFLADSYDRAYRTAWLVVRDRADAEEVVQEAFLRVWRFRDALPRGEAIRPWLYRVVVNAGLSSLRRERPRRDAALRASTEPVEPVPTPETATLDTESAAAVLAALAELPEHLRVAVVLRFWSQLSEREIAIVVRRRPGTVKSRLHEAKRRLAADPRLTEYRPELTGGTP